MCLNVGILKYLHPFEAAKYRQAARDIRAIGRDCIKRRIKMIENGEQVPNDILTHILQIPCKLIDDKKDLNVKSVLIDKSMYGM